MGANLQRLLLAASALGTAFAASGAAAQTAAAAAAAAGGQPVLEEIVVTAQKRSESVQRVPAAITAISAQTIQQRGLNEATDLAFVVPSLQAGKLLGNTNLVIRGVGLNLINTQAPPGVAIHVDGVFQPLPSMGDLNQVDLARVEVLRGPQGTLYGRNANGGVVNFITHAPTDKFEGYVQAGYASYDESRVQGVVNVPVNERVRARAVVDWNDREEGFYKNVIPGGHDVVKGRTLSGRLSVSADLTQDLTLDLVAAQLHATGPIDAFVIHGQPTPLSITANPILATAIVPQSPWRTSEDNPTELDRNSTFGAATLSWHLGGVQVKSITGYQRLVDYFQGSEDGMNVAFLNDHKHLHDRTITQEFDVSGRAGPVDYVLGAFYMDEKDVTRLDYTFPNGFNPLPATAHLVYNQLNLETKALAGFADGTWNITDRFRLLGGVRVSRSKVADTQFNFVLSAPGASPSISCNSVTTDVDFHSVTPRAGAQYDLSGSSNVYATYSKGFKDGGINRTTCGQIYAPEKVTAYEVGIKNQLLDNTLALNASAFYYDYTNLQLVQTFGLSSRITNAAAAEIKGVELEGTWHPDTHWTVSGNLSLLDAKYTSYSNTDTLAPSLGLQDVSGHYLNNAPRESANLGVAYRTDEYRIGSFTFRGDLSQKTKIFFREFNLPADTQPGYTIINLAAIWESPGGKYRVRLYADNVTNKGYLTSLFAVNNFGAYEASWGAPRQIGIELRANF